MLSRVTLASAILFDLITTPLFLAFFERPEAAATQEFLADIIYICVNLYITYAKGAELTGGFFDNSQNPPWLTLVLDFSTGVATLSLLDTANLLLPVVGTSYKLRLVVRSLAKKVAKEAVAAAAGAFHAEQEAEGKTIAKRGFLRDDEEAEEAGEEENKEAAAAAAAVPSSTPLQRRRLRFAAVAVASAAFATLLGLHIGASVRTSACMEMWGEASGALCIDARVFWGCECPGVAFPAGSNVSNYALSTLTGVRRVVGPNRGLVGDVESVVRGLTATGGRTAAAAKEEAEGGVVVVAQQQSHNHRNNNNVSVINLADNDLRGQSLSQ